MHFSDPLSPNDVDLLVRGLFEPEDLMRPLSQPEFDLFLRAVELVVLSQAFSPRGLALALRLRGRTAWQLTELLERGGIVTAEYDGKRQVLAEMRDLPTILFRLRERRDWAIAA